MRKANRSVGMLIGCVVWLGLGSVRADVQDWPQWRGPHRDGRATGFTAPETWPGELTQKWQVTVGDGVATPALVADKLYVFSRQGANEVTRCLRADTGEELWQDSYEAVRVTGSADSFPGPRSSPTVADGKVITLGVGGTLSCLEADTGKVLWRKNDDGDSHPRFFASSSPIVVDGVCVAQLGGDRDGAVVAYDLETGEQTWKWTGDGTAYASPVLVTVDGAEVLIAETDKRIVGLGVADGTLLWETPYAVSGRGYNAATPIVAGQTVIYTGSNRGAKAVKLAKQGDEFAAAELWSNDDNSVQFNTPVLKDDLLFGLSNRDVLFCINAESGETAWTAQLGARQRAADRPEGGARPGRRGRGGGGGNRQGYGSIVDAGSVVFALTPAAQLTVFEPSDTEFKQLASYQVSDSQTFAYPIVAGNRLFVKDENSVTLWTIE